MGRRRFSYRRRADVPALSWLAEVTADGVRVQCGNSVRCTEAGFVEGTWVGPPDIASIHRSTTVFGSALLDDGSGFVLVPPSHPLERLYVTHSRGRTQISNSVVWLLEASGLDLLRDALYPPIFVVAADGVRHTVIDIPTTGAPIHAVVYHNVRLRNPGGPLEIEERPHERPFDTFSDFRERLAGALRSAADNAPGYEMVATVSSGYDSTAVACVAAQVGCRRAVSFTTSKPVAGGASAVDSGAATARRLGMSVEEFDRLAYLRRTDLPEAEFLATGMSGEDVVMAAMERSLTRTILLTGAEEFRLKGNPYRPGLYRGDLSTCSLTEFRLRLDLIHVPLLFFGASQQPSLIRIIDSPEMRPYSVRGLYDKPIQRRIAEEAGIARGTFATVKRRSSAAIHAAGLAAMAPASADAVRAFAAAQGVPLDDRRRHGIGRRHRLLIRVAKLLRMPRLAASVAARRRALIHFEPEFGSLMFRWAVAQVRPRYAPIAGAEPVLAGQGGSVEGVTASVAKAP